MTDTRQQLRDQVQSIADEITNADPNADWWIEYKEYNDDDSETPHGYAYIHDALDFEHTIASTGEHLGSMIAVTLGGPNIYINTRYNRVEGYWGGDKATASYTDNLGVDDAAAEIYTMTR